MTFVTDYQNLLIKQYWEKPKAYAEIGLQAGTWERVYDFLAEFLTEFDIDLATGDRQDILGRVVGITRQVPDVSGGGSFELNDTDYRFFLRVKIAKNSGTAFMVSDDRISIQDVINQAFEGEAYVVDNQDMSLTLYVSPTVAVERLDAVRSLDLLPKPQGVRYFIVQAEVGDTFGFADNPDSKGFANKFDMAGEPGAPFATKVI